jgi:hypothetical protein
MFQTINVKSYKGGYNNGDKHKTEKKKHKCDEAEDECDD